MVNFSLRALVALFVFFSVSSVYAHNKVVVIPMAGDDLTISLADVKNLGTGSISAGNSSAVNEVTPTASARSFTIPAGKYLVITAMSVFPQSPGSGTVELQLVQNSAARKYWKLSNSEPSHLSFGPGMLIAPNYDLSINNFAASASSIRVAIYGYLTDA